MKKQNRVTVSADDKHYRRLRNREHAKLSRWRKRMLIATLEETVSNLQKENERLTSIIHDKLPELADEILLPQNKELSGAESTDESKDPPLDMYDFDHLINIIQ